MYTYRRIHAYTYICIHILTHTHTYIHTWIHIHIHTHIHVDIHIYIYICLCTYLYIYLYIYRICTFCREREANVYADVHNICLTYTPAHAWCSTTPVNACRLSARNAHGLVYARLCNCQQLLCHGTSLSIGRTCAWPLSLPLIEMHFRHFSREFFEEKVKNGHHETMKSLLLL